MPEIVKVWDNERTNDDGKPDPGWIEMYAIRAREALKRGKGRYSTEQPPSDAAAPREKKIVRVIADVPPDPIPQDWLALSWPERKKLAVTLGAEKNCTSDIANAIIGAEVKRREREAPLSAAAPETLPTNTEKELAP